MDEINRVTLPSAKLVDTLLLLDATQYENVLLSAIKNDNTRVVMYLTNFGSKFILNLDELDDIIGRALLYAVDNNLPATLAIMADASNISIIKMAIDYSKETKNKLCLTILNKKLEEMEKGDLNPQPDENHGKRYMYSCAKTDGEPCGLEREFRVFIPRIIHGSNPYYGRDPHVDWEKVMTDQLRF